MRSRRLISVLLLSALFVVGGAAQNTRVKLAHYDEKALLTAMTEVEDAERSLSNLTSQYEDELRKMENEYATKAADYQKSYDGWDETIRKTRMEELQTIKTKMQNYFDMAEQSIKTKKEELYKPIHDKIDAAVGKVAEENEFMYVWDVAQIKYHSKDAIDITGLIKRKMGLK